MTLCDSDGDSDGDSDTTWLHVEEVKSVGYKTRQLLCLHLLLPLIVIVLFHLLLKILECCH